MQDINRIAHATRDNAGEVLTGFFRDHSLPLLIQPRGEAVKESVPQLTRRIFDKIRAGFVDDTVGKFNYKLLLQLQDGLTDYLQGSMDKQSLSDLCDFGEVWIFRHTLNVTFELILHRNSP